eukprot:TRINITY_DN795_c0_g2_i1.p1 TRINITY_DN795_c0_g2~~TRINITY_DN795_c0_g2_i1.p1  ORF type:complete len:508 (+),score=37.11 TRINITY_DN795_c0_g2_i1:33-1526(+)
MTSPRLLYIVVLVSLKMLLMYSYKSTDFEVHRNWLAVTSKLPVSEWYQDQEGQSHWTLDYPPVFAYFERGLAVMADVVDSNMTQLDNQEYASERTVIFQRSTVIFGDVLLFLATHAFLSQILRGYALWASVTLVVFHPGLLIVDSIHFQYNSMLYALLVFSYYQVLHRRYISGAVLFTILICAKHLYLYMAPAYFIFLLKNCVLPSRKKVQKFVLLGLSVIGTTLVVFLPFLDERSLTGVLKRLFPWGRGLCHAYWAPNSYALYSAGDLVLQKVLKIDASTSVGTRGLVDGYDGGDTHAVLPSITPRLSTQITLLFVSILIVMYWSRPPGGRSSSRHVVEVFELIVLCSLSSAIFFAFSWHVHEKAILMVSLPSALLLWLVPGPMILPTLCIYIVGTFSLFPLLFQAAELPLKIALVPLILVGIPILAPPQLRLPPTNVSAMLFVAFLAIYQSLHPMLTSRYPFLPLLMLSVSSAMVLLPAFYQLATGFLLYSWSWK